PRRAAMAAWLAPLPPKPTAREWPGTVSPDRGRRATRKVRSTLVDPTTTTRGMGVVLRGAEGGLGCPGGRKEDKWRLGQHRGEEARRPLQRGEGQRKGHRTNSVGPVGGDDPERRWPHDRSRIHPTGPLGQWVNCGWGRHVWPGRWHSGWPCRRWARLS